MRAKEFLKKVVRIRKQLLRDSKSKRNFLQVCASLKPIELWLAAYPNANEAAARKVIIRHYAEVLAIIPGAGCTTRDRLMNELDVIMNGNQISLNI